MIDEQTRARILRLFHAEKWPVGTIATEIGVHHSTVRNALLREGLPLTSLPRRPTMLDPYLPFVQETLAKYPNLVASRLYQMVV